MAMTDGQERLGRYRLAAVLGVTETAVDRAYELNLLPPAGSDGRWPQAVAEDLRGRWAHIATAIEQAQELGAIRCAELLTRATDLPVSAADIGELERQGMLRATRTYRHRPLYRVADVQALADNSQTWEHLATIVAARQAQRRGGGQPHLSPSRRH